MSKQRQELLSRLGFRFGINGPHAARTMMLEDLRTLFTRTSCQASRDEYAAAVVQDNVLGKPTHKSRELAWRHMSALYGFEATNPIFRALQRLWPLNEQAQPQLAIAVALARDPLLQGSLKFFLRQVVGAYVPRESVEGFLSETFPDRFSAASLKSIAQNLGGTLTVAGFLHGRTRKTRALPEVHPESLAMLLFLGWLEGRTGQRLFTSDWVSMLNQTPEELESLTTLASHRGLLVFMNAGGVQELRFPGYLTAEEERIRQEVANVI
jgi:hypothetical protein